MGTHVRYGHMVHEYTLARVRAIMAARRDRLAALKTKRDAEKYVRDVRLAARRIFPALPRRTPLHARVTKTVDHGDFIVENILYESRPGFLVSANLYRPAGKNNAPQHPAVLGLCGHSEAGKSADGYQAFSQGLARRGFIVLIIDPIAQGERRQFYPKDGGARPSLCPAHNLMGNQLVLLDDSFASWRVWDAVRGIDYLCSRADVDRRHIGVTGNSGGGTMTSLVTAIDPRITMAAPSCYICSLQANLENELPTDAEQNPPGMIAAGLDHVDLLLAYAPRPTIILAQRHDFFDERAAHAAYDDLRKVHRLLGHRQTADYFSGPHGHGFSVENREAMYAFFCRHAGLRSRKSESAITKISPAELLATPKGETHPAGSRRVFDFTTDTATALATTRGTPAAKAVIQKAKRVLNLPRCKTAPHYRIATTYSGFPLGKIFGFRFAVETEPGIQSLLTSVKPVRELSRRIPTGRVTLFVGHTASGEDVLKYKSIGALVKKRQPFFMVDPRGIGEAAAALCDGDEFFAPYGTDFMYASFGDMLNESYLGRRVFDVMRVMDCLCANGVNKIDLVGRGLGAITVAFAALLHPTKPTARLIHYLPSYTLVAQTPLSTWPLSAIPRGILKHFDLPDVYRALGKRLTKTEPWDARMRPLKTKR